MEAAKGIDLFRDESSMTKEERFEKLSQRQKGFVEAALAAPDKDWPKALSVDAQVFLFMELAGYTESHAKLMVGSQGPCCIELTD